MGGWPRTLVGVLIGAALGTGTVRAASLRATFDPSPDPSVDSYLVFDCQGDATICTQDSYVSGSEVWTQVDSQPASVVCAATPCAETFTVGDPAPGQTETLTVAMVASDPAAPSLSGPSNVISVTLVGASTTSTTTSTTRAPTTTTSTTTSTTRAPTTTSSTSSTSSTTATASSSSSTTTTTSVASSTTLPPGIVCGNQYPSGGGLSMGWDSDAGVPCMTGNDPAGYVVVNAHVYAGEPGDPPSFRLGLYESNGASGNARDPAGPPLCESDIVSLVAGDNLIALPDCPVLAPSTRYYIIFVAASPDTQLGDVRRQACARSWRGRTGRHTSGVDSLSDPFPDADGVQWLRDYCQETLWLYLVPAPL